MTQFGGLAGSIGGHCSLNFIREVGFQFVFKNCKVLSLLQF